MTARGREQLVLELAIGMEPIAGRILGCSRHWIEFTGWLGLVAALDRARSPSATTKPTPLTGALGAAVHQPEEA
ncbi:MAG: hypothetical protein ACYC91_11100 [Solirubrobacteraceae bacterium]